MRGILISALFLWSAGAAAEPEASYDALIADARAAYAANDWATFAEKLDAAQALRPYSLFIARNRVLAHALLEEVDAATAIVEEIADRGLSISLSGSEQFDTIAAWPEFVALKERMDANLKPKGMARVHLTLEAGGLLPEALATSSKPKADYVGSVRSGKILRIDAEGDGGFALAPGGVYALEIADGSLWATANDRPPFESAGPHALAASLREYDLKDGALLNEYAVGDDAAILGAIEATPAGVVASDSQTPRLFILREGSAELALLSDDPRFVNLQGIAYDATRRRVYVADYLAGVFAVDLETGAATVVENAADAHLGGIDGLYPYKGDLIGIQNGTAPQRIIRLRLSPNGDAVAALDVLQQNLPEWNEPTNGAIVSGALIYIATSNWPAYADDGSLRENVPLKPLTLMRVDLD